MTEMNKSHICAIKWWLYGTAAIVFAMVVIGAITRLTESGLSMVEWRPLIGALPPMNEQEWLRVFDLYKQSPEYQKVNTWMTLEDFKTIFFWEWFHRLWGRLIGVVYALPLLFFWIKGWLPQQKRWHFIGLLVLGGAQGAMGWYMVKSGLVDNPAVSHFRLAAHLSLAFLVFVLLLLKGMALGKKPADPQPRFCVMRHFVLTVVLVGITIIWGAFTAGLDAGHIYNDTFPLMDGNIVPQEVQGLNDFWNNPAGVQMMHRWLAMGTVLFTLIFCIRMVWREKYRFASLYALGAMVVIQMCLGLATLMTNVALPLAVLHQAGALILIALLCLIFMQLRYTYD